MFSTAVAVVSVLVLVLPGFVIADLQRQERASVADESDWALVLRALSYSLLLHLAVSPWTKSLVLKLEDVEWTTHIAALIVYGLVVLVLTPVAIGLSLNEILRRAERSGKLRWWHYALGGRDARQAWDFMFQRLDRGLWLVVKLKTSHAVADKLGRASWVSQSPAIGGHDLWLEEIWTVDEFGRPSAMIEPRQGMWVARSDLEAVFVIDPPTA